MTEAKPKIYFRCSMMPVVLNKYNPSMHCYLNDDKQCDEYAYIDRQAFGYGRVPPKTNNNSYDIWCVAEAVLAHPERCLDDSKTKIISYISSIPQPVPNGTEANFETNISSGDLTDPEDLELIYGMAGSDLDKESPHLYILYLTESRKYIRRIKVTRDGIKVPVPVSIAATSEFSPRVGDEGCMRLKVPIKDKMAFDDHLNELDIVEDLSSADKAVIIIFHDIKYAVAYLMAHANADVKAGENSWVAKWSDTVSKHVKERRQEEENKRKANEEYVNFINSLPPAPGYKPKRKKTKFNWGRFWAIVAGLFVGFCLGELMFC